jgi:signal recognition particle GTPase
METNITSANVAMETAKQVLNNVSNDKRNSDYKNIIQLIEKYLIDHSEDCDHNIIKDLIDIDPDRSKMIKYCTICYKTF